MIKDVRSWQALYAFKLYLNHRLGFVEIVKCPINFIQFSDSENQLAGRVFKGHGIQLSAYLISDSLAYRHDLLLHLYDSNVQSINKVLRIISYSDNDKFVISATVPLPLQRAPHSHLVVHSY
jgi:hypothetical protein